MKMHELLASSDNWTRCAMARDQDGLHTATKSPDARSWCLMWAFMYCYRRTDDASRNERVVAAFRLYTTFPLNDMPMLTWNDAPDRTHDEVLQLLKHLDV